MVAQLHLTVGGIDGMKAYAAATTAASAARAASNYAIKMAQSASLAEAKAIQARQNLEKYVFGTAVSTVPPVITPMLPTGVSNYPSYPYVSSPTQWGQGVTPITAEFDMISVVASVHLSGASSRRISEAIKNFI